jgi:molybdate transport system substrate-binding protein
VDEIGAAFTKATGIPLRISAGSTGKLYAQIIYGAPYDVFLAADSTRPGLLEENGYAIAGSRRTYAIGALVLWSSDRNLRGRSCRKALSDRAFKRIAIANPTTAPYGRAAKEFLAFAGLWDDVSSRVVYGENIAQTLQFVATGNATLGLIAASQTRNDLTPTPSCSWSVPASAHSEILQQAVLLSRSNNKQYAIQFLNFLQGATAIEILGRHGYGVPR